MRTLSLVVDPNKGSNMLDDLQWWSYTYFWWSYDHLYWSMYGCRPEEASRKCYVWRDPERVSLVLGKDYETRSPVRDSHFASLSPKPETRYGHLESRARHESRKPRADRAEMWAQLYLASLTFRLSAFASRLSASTCKTPGFPPALGCAGTPVLEICWRRVRMNVQYPMRNLW